MDWRWGLVGLGHVMKGAVRGVGLAAWLGLLALPAGAGDSHTPGGYSYPAPGFFADGLTAESSWEQILKPRMIVAQFPMLNFGNSFVPLSVVCVEGDTLRIADPRIDNGVRVSVTHVPGPGRARVGTTGYAAARADQFAVGNVADTDLPLPGEAPAASISYPVSVYKVMPQPLTNQFVYLFDKPWEVPTCANGIQGRRQVDEDATQPQKRQGFGGNAESKGAYRR